MRTLSNDRRSVRRALGLLAVVAAGSGCVLPSPGTPVPPAIGILAGDPRAGRYGSTAAAMIDHPDVRDKVRALFGADWGAGAGGPRRLAGSAPEFFARSGPPQVLRADSQEYIGASGCLPRTCASHRGLLLVRMDGEELLARVDEGGFTVHYVFGTAVAPTPETRALIDAAARALARAGIQP